MIRTRVLLAVYLILASVPGASVARADVYTEARELARALERGELAELQKGAAREGPLRDLFQLHAARILVDRERDLPSAQKLLAGIPTGPTQARAAQLQIEAMVQVGRNVEAAALARASGLPLLSPLSQDEQDLLQAQALRRAGKHGEADTVLLQLAAATRRGAVSRQAIQELYRRYRAGLFAPVPSKPSLLLEFAQVLMHHRFHAHVIDLCMRVVRAPKVSTEEQIGRAWFLLGKVYASKRNRWYAAKCFLDAASRLGDGDSERGEALYLRGNAFKQLGQTAKAKAMYQQALGNGGSHGPAARWQLAHLDLEAGNQTAGLAGLRLLARKHPSSYFAPKALWEVANILQEAGASAQDVKDAYLAFVEHFGDHRLANAARFRAAQAAHDGHALRIAEKLWNACIDEPAIPDLYSLFAAQRLAGVTRLTFAGRHGPGWSRILERFPEDVTLGPRWTTPDETLPKPALERILALKAARLHADLASDLAWWSEKKAGRGFRTRAALAWAHYHVDDYRKAVGIFETHFASGKPLAGPEVAAFLSGMYPQAYREHLAPWAETRGISPHLAFAIAREESHFAPDLQSWADARGLMQVIPPTAAWIAERLKKDEPGDLYDPAVSAELGTWYLSHLLEIYREEAEAEALAIAAYNGGPGNVRRWSKKCSADDLLGWMDAMDREETFFYVYKVTRSMMAYEAISQRMEAGAGPAVAASGAPAPSTHDL